jgi:hypothetical protein
MPLEGARSSAHHLSRISGHRQSGFSMIDAAFKVGIMIIPASPATKPSYAFGTAA